MAILSRKVFLYGYHGRRNIGDDSTCVSFANTLKKILESSTIIYVWINEGYIVKNFVQRENPNFHFASSFITALKAVMDSQVVIIAGGDYLDDYGRLLRRLKVFALLFILAILTKISLKRFLIVNGGFRATTRIGMTFVRIILSITSCVSTRDSDSFALLSRYVRRPTEKGFDTAVLLDCRCRFVPNANSRNIGFSITPVFSNFFGNREKDAALARVIAGNVNDLLHDVDDVNLHFLAFNTDSEVGDLNLITRIMKMLDADVSERVKLLAYTGNVSRFLSEFSRLDAVICCKYHSVVFSYLFQKPMMLINYHPKNAALAHELGLSNRCLISLKDIFSGKLSSALLAFIDNSDTYRARLPVNEAKQRAFKGVQKVLACAFR